MIYLQKSFEKFEKDTSVEKMVRKIKCFEEFVKQNMGENEWKNLQRSMKEQTFVLHEYAVVESQKA